MSILNIGCKERLNNITCLKIWLRRLSTKQILRMSSGKDCHVWARFGTTSYKLNFPLAHNTLAVLIKFPCWNCERIQRMFLYNPLKHKNSSLSSELSMPRASRRRYSLNLRSNLSDSCLRFAFNHCRASWPH